MKVYVYPADVHGCGYHRLIWAGTYLGEQGYDVEVVMPGTRQLHMDLRGNTAVAVRMPEDCDVAVFQRVTNRYMAGALGLMRQQGIAVVVDVDDDLTDIHPQNPAWSALLPQNEGRRFADGTISHHSWEHLNTACRNATMVTVSSPALMRKYAPTPEAGRVIYNHLAEHYYGIEHTDSAVIGWPATLHSHPSDPSAVGNSIARLVNERGADFVIVGPPAGVGRAFGLAEDPPGIESMTSVEDWPRVVSEMVGVGICPLDSTPFNRSKSWLKPLELSALGIPWVASALPEYERLWNYGAGTLAHTPKEWFKALRALTSSEEIRAEFRGRGHDVADLWRMKPNAWRWWEAWEDAYNLQKAEPRRRVQVP